MNKQVVLKHAHVYHSQATNTKDIFTNIYKRYVKHDLE